VTREFKIGARTIDDESDCYIIAELGHNHQGSVARAKEMTLMAQQCGADAVKLQKRDNRTLYTFSQYEAPYENENSFGATYGKHREHLELGWDEYVELVEYAREIGIDLFATAFDFPSADFLDTLGVPAIKIASGDLNNLPLLKHVAECGRPMIISTGGGTESDIRLAYETIRPINEQVCILLCTAAYPASFDELNLRVIETLRAQYAEVVVGFSSHDNGIAMPVAAYVLGARVIEKHVTFDRAAKGTDHAFSLERPGLQRMVRDLRNTRIALGARMRARRRRSTKWGRNSSPRMHSTPDIGSDLRMSRSSHPRTGFPHRSTGTCSGASLFGQSKQTRTSHGTISTLRRRDARRRSRALTCLSIPKPRSRWLPEHGEASADACAGLTTGRRLDIWLSSLRPRKHSSIFSNVFRGIRPQVVASPSASSSRRGSRRRFRGGQSRSRSASSDAAVP
jgi:sialic acid synthase